MEKVTTDEIFKWRQLRVISASSKNRELSLIRTIFETARLEWRWVLDNPCKDIKRLPEPPSRDRRISEHEIQLLCEDLDFDLHNPIIETQKQTVALVFLFALETAMRQSEITTLDWSQVNLRKKYLTILTTKNGEKRDVPLSSRAIEFLQLMGEKRSGDIFNITADTVSTMFRRSVKKCRIIDLTFHDARHEACTRLARKIEVLDLARMIGHRDLRSLMIYYNPTASEIADRLG